jgi:hypothetical protein
MGTELSTSLSGAVLPISPGQRALWFLSELGGEAQAYQLAFAWKVLSPVDASRLRQALQRLTQKHESLRTMIRSDGNGPYRFRVDHLAADFDEVDLGEASEAQVLAWVQEEVRRPFRLETSPPLRTRLLRTREGTRMTLVVHHLAVDFWSLVLLAQDLGAFYESGDSPLEPAGGQNGYSEFVSSLQERLAGEEGAGWASYWKQALSEVPNVLALPKRGTEAQSQRRESVHSFWLDPDVSDRLIALGQAQGTTPYVVFLTAYQLALSELTGQREFFVGSPFSARKHSSQRRTVGYFVNLLPMRAQVRMDQSFVEHLARGEKTARSTFAHGQFPLSAMEAETSGPPFQATFSFERAHRRSMEALTAQFLGCSESPWRLGPLEILPLPVTTGALQAEMELTLAQLEGRVRARFGYDRDLFDPALIARFMRRFERLLQEVALQPELPLESLALTSHDDASEAFGPRVSSSEPFVSEFERQALKSPEAAALKFDGGRMSYSELADEVTKVAGALRSLGVGPESVVALWADGSPRMVSSLLAVWKAGGALLLLDPMLPLERLQWLVRDVGAILLLAPRAKHAES